MVYCETNRAYCMYRVTYTTVGGCVAHWDLMAKDSSHAITSASELLPIGSVVKSAALKEEW